MITPPDLAVIIVSWNVWDRLRATLDSLARESFSTETTTLRRFGPEGEATVRIVVVDNGSVDATPSLLHSMYPWVESICVAENLGFSAGNNRGLCALGFGEGEEAAQLPGAVYFLNPDTELMVGSLWALYSGLKADPSIGAIGPQLRYADSSIQSSRRRFPGPLTGFFESTWLGRTLPRNPWAASYHLTDQSPLVAQDVDWLVGAALMVRGSVLHRIGGFDPRFFMYSEETDLCRRIVDAGWRIVYEPSAVVIHYEGRSSEQVSALRHLYFNRSKIRYAAKHFGRPWAELLRLYLLLEYRWQILIESLKLVLGRQPALRRERIAAYRRVIESGLR